jgi:GNAT superfamily N-acetyltransferase
MTRILSVDTEELIAKARGLFLEYAASLGFDLGFQEFEKEMVDFPDEYSSPRGSLLLAFYDDELAGCVALRDLSNGICEMRRLYVKPAFRGLKVGRAIAEAIIEAGKNLGYTHMRLDTVPCMKEAISVYSSLGFKEIEPYRYNPIEGATYIELALH